VFNPLSRLLCGAATLALLALSQSSRAGPLTLQDLLDGASIQVGNTTFTNFGQFQSVAYGGAAVDASQVLVTATARGMQVGLVLQSPTQFRVFQNQTQLTHLEYDVFTSAASQISGASMSFTAGAQGNGVAAIDGALTNVPGGLSVSTALPVSQAHALLTAPIERVHVVHDITLIGGSNVGSMTFVNDFTMMCDNPEPSSLTLLALGGAVLIGFRWRYAAGRCTGPEDRSI
jgi:hypothetical protein